jgi:predicted ABC-type ATPase
MVFIFVSAAETCIDRVKERVARGGHKVPDADVARRFTRSLRNFWHAYRDIAEEWELFYNGGKTFMRVASGQKSRFLIAEEPLFESFWRS